MTIGSTAEAEFWALLDERKRTKLPVDRQAVKGLLGGIVDRLDEERTKFAEETKLAERLKKKAAAATPRKTKLASDEEFLASLEANPAYTGLDIRRELGKAQAWAFVRGQGVSQRRFVNWLNKAASEAPMAVNGQGQSSHARSVERNGIPEPAAWRAWVRENAMNPENADKPWASFDLTQQRCIVEQMAKVTA